MVRTLLSLFLFSLAHQPISFAGSPMPQSSSLYESILNLKPGSYEFVTPHGKWIFMEFRGNGGGSIIARNSNRKDSPNIAYFAYVGSTVGDVKLGYLEIKKKSTSELSLKGVRDGRYHDANLTEFEGALVFDESGNKLVQVNLEFRHTSAGMIHDPQKTSELIR